MLQLALEAEIFVRCSSSVLVLRHHCLNRLLFGASGQGESLLIVWIAPTQNPEGSVESTGVASTGFSTRSGKETPFESRLREVAIVAILHQINASQTTHSILDFMGSISEAVCLGIAEIRRAQFSAPSSHTLRLKIERVRLQKGRRNILGTILCASQRRRHDATGKKDPSSPQNVDLPPVLPKRKKKPYPIPFKKMVREARKDKKLAQMGIEKPLEPPKNGLLIPELIPVAHEVLDAWKLLIRGIAQLLHVVPVYSCSECSEIHVAQTGHHIQNCLGVSSRTRRSFHSWVRGSINDVLIPIESYHLYDPFGRRIKHETRFEYDRIPAVVELCIQAGVYIPEYPSRRRTNPVRMIGKKVTDRGGFVEEPKPRHSEHSSSLIELDTYGAFRRFPPPPPEDVPRIAQETIGAYEVVRGGVTNLMKRYTVKACGYCSEVHVGPWGHNVKLCGAFKHQWRDGKHGWQDATADEVFPPNYVWHVRDPHGPPLLSALKRYYGKAPAVVEMCMQAGAKIPDKYRSMMRLDIIVPENEETGLVA